jgi:hypothetical protein
MAFSTHLSTDKVIHRHKYDTKFSLKMNLRMVRKKRVAYYSLINCSRQVSKPDQNQRNTPLDQGTKGSGHSAIKSMHSPEMHRLPRATKFGLLCFGYVRPSYQGHTF